MREANDVERMVCLDHPVTVESFSIMDEHHARIEAMEAQLAALQPKPEQAEWPKWVRNARDGAVTRFPDDSSNGQWWNYPKGTENAVWSGDYASSLELGYVDITHAEAVALIPAIAKDYPLPSAKESPAEWPEDVVKVWEMTGPCGSSGKMQWRLHDTGDIYADYPPFRNWVVAGSSEKLLDGGRDNGGSTVNLIYTRPPKPVAEKSVEDAAMEWAEKHSKIGGDGKSLWLRPLQGNSQVFNLEECLNGDAVCNLFRRYLQEHLTAFHAAMGEKDRAKIAELQEFVEGWRQDAKDARQDAVKAQSELAALRAKCGAQERLIKVWEGCQPGWGKALADARAALSNLTGGV